MNAIVPPIGELHPFLPDFKPPARRRRTARFSLAPREALFMQGDGSRHIFTIVQGAMMILREMPDGRRQIVDVARAGRTIGFTANRRHDCTALALTACDIHQRPRTPGADDVLMLAEIQRLRDLAILLGRKTAIERLATFLQDMIGEDFDLEKPLDFPVCRQEIADYLGMALETVCRNFVALKKRGVIAPANRESVFIRDSYALNLIAAGLAHDGSAWRRSSDSQDAARGTDANWKKSKERRSR